MMYSQSGSDQMSSDNDVTTITGGYQDRRDASILTDTTASFISENRSSTIETKVTSSVNVNNKNQETTSFYNNNNNTSTSLMEMLKTSHGQKPSNPTTAPSGGDPYFGNGSETFAENEIINKELPVTLSDNKNITNDDNINNIISKRRHDLENDTELYFFIDNLSSNLKYLMTDSLKLYESYVSRNTFFIVLTVMYFMSIRTS